MPAKRGNCKVCEHKQIRVINRRLADPANSARSVAIEFEIEPRTMQRHYSNCIQAVVQSVIAPDPVAPGAAVVPLTQKEIAIGADVVYSMIDLQAKTLALLQSIPAGKVKDSCLTIREIRQNYALIARLTGKLNGSSEEGAKTITFQEFRTMYLTVQHQKEAA